jgi:hypothetical protein
MDNLGKARRVVELILQDSYAGNEAQLVEENESVDKLVQRVYFWLEDGNGDGIGDNECRLLFEM